MKRFSDYQGEEALELWADILESAAAILGDKEIKEIAQSGQHPLIIAQKIIKLHAKEMTDILLKIDDTPINGLNILARVIDVISEFESSPELRDFLKLQSLKTEGVSFGSATENTEASATFTNLNNITSLNYSNTI